MTIFYVSKFGDKSGNFKRISASNMQETIAAVQENYGLTDITIGVISNGIFVEIKDLPLEEKSELIFRNKTQKRKSSNNDVRNTQISKKGRIPDLTSFLDDSLSDYFHLIPVLINVDSNKSKAPKEGFYKKGTHLPLSFDNSLTFDFCLPERNPLINTEGFQNQIRQLKEGFKEYDTIVGCGVSGAGKSTLGVALGKESFFVIYFEISVTGSTDITHGDGCSMILNEIIKNASDQTRVKYLLKLDLLARLVLLFLLLKDGTVSTPLQWINAQFNEPENINTILNSLLDDNFEPKQIIFDSILKWIKDKTKKSILLVRDESQILTKDHFGEYDNFSKNKKWNLLQFSSAVYAELKCKQFILGTYLHMAHAQSLASANGGKPMNTKGVFLYIDFPFVEKLQVLPMIERVLDLDGIAEEYLELAKNKLYGRCRLSCGFVSYYCNYKGSLKSLSKSEAFGCILKEYIDFAIEKFADYLVSLRDAKTSRIEINHIQMLKTYFSPGVSLITDTDAFQFGIIPFLPKNGFLAVQRDDLKSLEIQLNKNTEPLLLLGMIRYFTKAENTNVYDVFIKSVIGMSGNLGNEIDFLVPLCFIRSSGLTLVALLKSIGCDCPLPAWCTGDIKINVDKISHGDVETFLDASSISEKTTCILPPNASGSDGLFALYSNKERVAFATIGNCIRKGKVENTKIDYQMIKTDLRNQYLTRQKHPNPIIGIPLGFEVSGTKKTKARATIEKALKKANGNQIIFSI